MQRSTSFLTIVLLFLLACNDRDQAPGQVTVAGQELIARNHSITRTYAYSDLFLDSTAMEAFIAAQQLNDTVSAGMRSFYNARNYQYAWFASDGLTEQALAFRNLYDYTKDSGTSRKSLDRRLENFMARDTLDVQEGNVEIRKTELLLTWRFVNYVWDKYDSKNARQLALAQLVPSRKYAPLELAKIMTDEKDPPNKNFAALQKQVEQYASIVQKGGWSFIPTPKKKLKKGINDTAVVLLKKRLQAVGLLDAADTSAVFNDQLDAAVRNIQSTYGLKADGLVTPALLKELNVPARKRLEQLMVNLERMRWMPAEASGSLILVNIPAFKLYVRDGMKELFNMDVVVGKEGHSTVMFSGNLNQVVFNPYWNIPESIVRKEVLPEIAKDSNYLADHNMEVTGEEDGLPVIRQRPGGQNQLGKIKFLFPNRFNIYFHDTPYKDLFNKDKRAFSHGCIRLREPEKLAEYLLMNQSQWTREKIDSAMSTSKERFVKVKDPVPVLIYYYTAWVESNKQLQFREDIYGYDERLAQKMFVPADSSVPLATR